MADDIAKHTKTLTTRIAKLEEIVNALAQNQVLQGQRMIAVFDKVGQLAIAMGLVSNEEAAAAQGPIKEGQAIFNDPRRDFGPDAFGGVPITPIDDARGEPASIAAPLVDPGGHPLRSKVN